MGGAREKESASRGSRMLEEVRERPVAYGVLAVFLALGPVFTHFVFPEAPPAIGLFGGLAFGIYAALCAVPEKFI